MIQSGKNTSLLLFIIAVINLAACKKNPVDPSADNIKWEKYKGISTEVGLLNSSFTDGHLNILGTGAYFKNIPDPYGASVPNSFLLGLYDGGGRYKFPVPVNYYALINGNNIVLRSALTVQAESVETSIDIKTLDPDFFQWIDIPYWQGERMAISQNNYLLVPYKAVKNNFSVPTPYFLLAKIAAPVNQNTELKIVSTALIRQDLLLSESIVSRIQTINNNFFVVMGPYTYRIDTLGNIKLAADKALHVFQKGQELFAFSPNINTGKIEYLQSIDEGKSWQLLGAIAVDLLANLQYTIIENKLIGFGKGQLFQIELNGTNYIITELENEGLGLADITSVSKANDRTVFITSRCNTFSSDCGGYYKPIQYFFTKKKP